MPARRTPRRQRDDQPLPGDQAPARLAQLAQATSLCGRGLRRAIHERTRNLGLTDADLLVLWSCARRGDLGVAQSCLAREAGLSAAQTSGLLDRLRQTGLVSAHRPSGDRRRQLWHLEPEGERMLSAALAVIDGLAGAVLEHLSVADQLLLEKLLAAVENAAEQAAGGGIAGNASGKEAA